MYSYTGIYMFTILILYEIQFSRAIKTDIVDRDVQMCKPLDFSLKVVTIIIIANFC